MESGGGLMTTPVLLFEQAKRSRAILARAIVLPVAGSDRNLREYWVHGEGAIKIGWGTPGDFDRCVSQLDEHVGDPKGLCAEYHHEATGTWPGQHGGKHSGSLFERARATRQRLAEIAAKFDPTQKRDDDGKWSAFGGIPAFAKEHLFADGTVSAKVDRGGLQLHLKNNAGGSNRSGGLDIDSRWELSELLDQAAGWSPDEDGYPGGGDNPEMVRSSVYTYPDNGDDHATPTGYAQVAHDGTGNIEVELLDSEDPIRLTRAEARHLSETVRRSAGVSRISLPSGPMDVFPTDDNKIGLRLNAADGSVKELGFDGESWTRMRNAMAVVVDGADEMELFGKNVPGPDGEYPDVDVLEFDTNVGRLRVSRGGGPFSYEDGADNASIKTTVAAADGSWSFTTAGTYKTDESIGAFGAVQVYAGDQDWPGIENAVAELPVSVTSQRFGTVSLPVAAGAAAKVLSRAALVLLGEFDEGKHKRDRRGRFSKSAAQVVSELDDLMAKLSALTKDLGDDEDDKYDADQALDALKSVRERRHERANRREATMETANGDVALTIDGDGDVSFDFDNGSFFMPAAEAKQLAGVLDQFRATEGLDTSVSVSSGASELTKVPLGDDGTLAALLWSNGLVEIGPADDLGGEDGSPDVLLLEDFDEVADFADLLEELADRSLAGQPSNSVVVLPQAKFNPDQHRDAHGRWSDGRLDGLDVMSGDEYLAEFGEVADEVNIADTALTVRVFDSGQAHLVLDLPEGRSQVLSEDLDGEGMRGVFYAIEEMRSADLSDHPDDHNEVVEESSAGGVTVGAYGGGDYRLIFDGTDDYLDLTEVEAADLAKAFEEMGDFWDEKFTESGPTVLVSDSALRLPRNHPGHPDQSTHGRKKKKLPDLPDVDVPKPEKTAEPKPPRKRAAPKAPAKPKAPAEKAPAEKAAPKPNDPPAVKPAKPSKKAPAAPKTDRQLAAEAHVKTLTAGLPASLRKPVADALTAQAQIAPSSVMKLRGLGFDDLGGGFAEYKYPAGVINFNERWKTNKRGFDAAAKASHADGYLAPTGSPTMIGAVVAHEFGHRIAFRFVDPNARGISPSTSQKLLGPLAAALGVSPPAPRGPQVTYDSIKQWMATNRRRIQSQLSEYAAESIHELFGEAWQEFSTRGDAARPVAKAVGKALLAMSEGGA